jgi:hypothetical protein
MKFTTCLFLLSISSGIAHASDACVSENCLKSVRLMEQLQFGPSENATGDRCAHAGQYCIDGAGNVPECCSGEGLTCNFSGLPPGTPANTGICQ